MDKKKIKSALTYLPAEQIKHENKAYTLFPNKNGGLCDITPMNAWSDSFLEMHMGADIRILATMPN